MKKNREDKEKEYFVSNKFKEGVQQQVIADTWGKGLPMVYMNEDKKIVKHWADGRIEVVKEEPKYLCNKVKFGSEKDALFSLKKIKETSDREIIPIRAYHCKCGAWHLTSKRDVFKDDKRVEQLEAEIETLNIKIAELEKTIKDNNTKSVQTIVKKGNEKINEKISIIKAQLKVQKEMNKRLRNDNNQLISKLHNKNQNGN
jgi:hypothetical protein